MEEVLRELRAFAEDSLPSLIVPVAILLVGWIAALLVSALIRRALRRTRVDQAISRRILGEERAREFNSARWVGKIVYYIILLLTAVAFLEATKLSAASEPIGAMLQSVLEFLPLLFAAAAISFAAWIIASLTRSVLARALERWGMDRRLQEQGLATTESEGVEASEGEGVEASEGEGVAAGETRQEPVAGAVADAAYWLVLLLFVPAILSALRIHGLLVPVQEMLNRALGFLPNIVSAVAIGGVGWMVARMVQKLTASALEATGANRLSERVGLSKILGQQTLSQLLGFVAYVLVLVPVAVGALNALQLEAITRPASSMLESFFTALPAIFGAALVIGVSYVVARLLAGAVSKLLNGIGFDNVLRKIGVAREEIAERTPSDLVGGLVFVTVLYFAALEAAKLLAFTSLVALGSSFANMAGHVLLGLAIFGLGLYLARVAAEGIESSDVTQRKILAVVARGAIIVLGSAMALRQMGIADEIIELAFGLVLGGLAIAAALAFGLGGRDAASKTLDDMRKKLRESEEPRGRPGTPLPAGMTGSPERDAER